MKKITENRSKTAKQTMNTPANSKMLFFNSGKSFSIDQGIKRFINKCEIIKGAFTEFLKQHAPLIIKITNF